MCVILKHLTLLLYVENTDALIQYKWLIAGNVDIGLKSES